MESVAISKPPDAFVILDAPSQQILCSVLALHFVKYFKGTPRFRVLHVLPYPLSLGDNLGGEALRDEAPTNKFSTAGLVKVRRPH